MANTKISALTSATTPLAGTETLPVVQSGATTKVTVANLTAGRSVAVLDLTSTNDSLINSITSGRGAGNVSTSTVFGNGAFITNTSGLECTAIGYQALRLNTQGYNTVIGSQAGANNSTGGITAIGARTLQNNTTGVGNVAVGGYDATTSYQAALRSNQTGNYNTAMGNGALTGVTASNNTGFGFMAGYNLSTGTNCIYIGYFPTASASSVSNEIVIGASLTGKGANTAYIGGSSGAYNGANSLNWATVSDQTIKKNIENIDNALPLILSLRPVEFDYIANGNHDAGFIAQEYEKVFPDQIRKQESGLLAIQQNLVPYLVKAVQELTAQVNQLQMQLGKNNV